MSDRRDSFISNVRENNPMKKNNVIIKIYQQEKLNQFNVSSIKTNLALCYHADKDGLCYPTKGTLERLTGLSKRSIYRAIPALIEAGVVREEFTNMSGVTVYRVTRKGSFMVLDCADLSAIMDINTKADIIKELDRLRGGDKNSVTPDKKVVTPPANSVTPYTSYREKELTIKLELDTMNHLEGIELTTTEINYFNSLWNRYSVRSSSLWRSDDPLTEFKSIYGPVATLFDGKKNLVTELRAFDAYLLELEARRLGGFNKPYSDSPFVYAGRGWLKGLKRWLEAPSPATLGEKRRQIIAYHGIKAKEVHETADIQPPETKIVIKGTEKQYKDAYGLTIPPESVEDFHGPVEARKWIQYQIDAARKYPDLDERVKMVSLEAEYWTEEDIRIINTTPELDNLALWSWFTVANIGTLAHR